VSSELHTLTGAYALHALPAEEEAEFERHLRECDDCAQEVRELEATTAYLGAAAAVVPPPELRGRVVAQVARVRQESPRSVVAPLPRRRWWSQATGVAAALLLAVSLGLGGVVLEQRSELSDAEREAQTVAAVLADPQSRTVSAPLGTASATVVVADDRAVFVATELAELPEDRTYQLWTIRGGGTVIRSAGLLEDEAGTTQGLVEGVGPVEALAVSVEPEGGSEQPTQDQILGLVELA
jgi:anti-sigma-K factor RskA